MHSKLIFSNIRDSCNSNTKLGLILGEYRAHPFLPSPPNITRLRKEGRREGGEEKGERGRREEGRREERGREGGRREGEREGGREGEGEIGCCLA